MSDYAVVGGGQVFAYNNDPRALTWTDGTPTASATNNNGIYINNLQNGFSFTAPADTGTRTLTVHVGGWMSGGTFTAHLSDLSAAVTDAQRPPAAITTETTRSPTKQPRRDDSDSHLVTTSGAGNVTLNGAALTGGTSAPGSPTIAATAGTPQSATVGTAFATALQAVVIANSLPASGVTVTFTTPGSGAGATFSGSATATAVTNASGVAVAPLLTANGVAGSYTLTASAPRAGTANFSLTNLAGCGPLAATAGTPQTATMSTVFCDPVTATVTDAGDDPLGGVTVTFQAPGGEGNTSFAGSATATAVTNASGVATSPALTANGQTGTYTVVASAAGVPATAAFSLTNALAPVAPITFVQQARIDSMIDVPSQSAGVRISRRGGKLDSRGDIQRTIQHASVHGYRFERQYALSRRELKAIRSDGITLGIYYAQNINSRPNTVKVVPDDSGYLRVVIVEYCRSGENQTRSM